MLSSIIRVVAVALLVFAAVPSLAAEPVAPAPSGRAPYVKVDRVAKLHDALKLTKEQEPQWEIVAKAFRDSDDSSHALAQTRRDNITKGMNAVDNQKAYLAIIHARAEGIAKFIAVLEPFYASLTAEQKKAADAYFAALGKHKSKTKDKAKPAG